MSIKVEITGTESLLDKARSLIQSGEVIVERTTEAARRFMGDAGSRSIKNHLSGPRPGNLASVTGRLRASITSRVSRENANVEAVLGTNVVYGRVHELGFAGTVQVPAHQRLVTKAFGNNITATVSNVRAHSRTMVFLRDRAFLAPAVGAAMPAFEDSIRAILNKTITATGGIDNAG